MEYWSFGVLGDDNRISFIVNIPTFHYSIHSLLTLIIKAYLSMFARHCAIITLNSYYILKYKLYKLLCINYNSILPIIFKCLNLLAIIPHSLNAKQFNKLKLRVPLQP